MEFDETSIFTNACVFFTGVDKTTASNPEALKIKNTLV
jgi:hypothetical protein